MSEKSVKVKDSKTEEGKKKISLSFNSGVSKKLKKPTFNPLSIKLASNKEKKEASIKVVPKSKKAAAVFADDSDVSVVRITPPPQPHPKMAEEDACTSHSNQEWEENEKSKEENEEQSTFKKNFGFLGPAESKKDGVSTNSKVALLGGGNMIIVNCCQKGNPVLDLIKAVPWKYADSTLPVDYILASTTGCLFLSLRYHALKPEYIYERMKVLRQSRSFSLRLLICLVDVKDPNHVMVELTKVCLVYDITLLMAFSNEEVATYLETFKSFQKKSADSIKTRPSKSNDDRLTEVLSSVRTINSTDAHTLLSAYNTVAGVAEVSKEELGICPGIGGIKAKSLHTLFNEPFLKKPNDNQ